MAIQPEKSPVLSEELPPVQPHWWQNPTVLGSMVLLGVMIIAGGFYLATQQTSTTPTQLVATPKPTFTPTPTATPDTASENTEAELDTQPSGARTINLKPKVTDPNTLGFTKLIDLPGIGIRAAFPVDTKISYYNPSVGYTSESPKLQISFTIQDYDGGSRRSWYSNTYGSNGVTFEPFGANNHQGYISYIKSQDNSLYRVSYFSTLNTKRMLVLDIWGQDSNDLEKIRSFLSTMKIINPNTSGVERSDQEKRENLRWSDTRTTLWKDDSLGLRITTPEWVESRITKGKKSDGSWEYGEWTRFAPITKTSQSSSGKLESIWVIGEQFYMKYIALLSSSYNTKSFAEVVTAELLGAGGCANEWSDTAPNCGPDSNPDFCYSRSDIERNLKLVKSAKVGPYTAQLRGMNTNMSQKWDCREGAIWLIKAKNGQFVKSSISPDGELDRIEGF